MVSRIEWGFPNLTSCHISWEGFSMPHKLHATNQQDTCREPQLGRKTAVSYQKQLLLPGSQDSASWDQNHQPQLFISTSGTRPDPPAGGLPTPLSSRKALHSKHDLSPRARSAVSRPERSPCEVRRKNILLSLHHLSAWNSGWG